MKKHITVIAAVVALLTLSAASSAAAGDLFDVSGSGVLVRHDDGYIITGALRDADGQVVGTLHGTLTELTTGFNTCPIIGTASALCFPGPPSGWPCNLLGGDITLNFQGAIYDATVNTDVIGHAASALCKNADRTAYDRLVLFMWSTSHVTPGDFPDIFTLVATSVQQISPTVWKWSS
jgi:hypothetical protein